MKKFEPEYISYKKRILGGISYPAIGLLLIIFLLFGADMKNYLLFSLGFLLLLLLWSFYSLARHGRKYLKSLLITNTYIVFTIVDRDMESNVIETPLEDIRIRVFELFLSKYKPGRDFKLQIDLKQKRQICNGI